jgi:uncharacterized protein YjdB
LGIALVALVIGACDSTGPGKADTISLVIRTQSMVVGDTAKVIPLVLDSENVPVTNPTVTWTSTHEAVATVDSNGVVTAKGAGTTIVTAAVDGAKGTVGVTVTEVATGQTGD